MRRRMRQGLAHLCAALFAQSSLGAPVTMIPYRGGAPAVTDILAGHADLYCSAPSTAIEQIKAGTIKAFAVTSPGPPRLGARRGRARSRSAIPISRSSSGSRCSRRPPRRNRSSTSSTRRCSSALADAKVLKNFSDTGMSAFTPAAQSPEAATAKLKAEITRWGEVIRANKIEVGQ